MSGVFQSLSHKNDGGTGDRNGGRCTFMEVFRNFPLKGRIRTSRSCTRPVTELDLTCLFAVVCSYLQQKFVKLQPITFHIIYGVLKD